MSAALSSAPLVKSPLPSSPPSHLPGPSNLRTSLAENLSSLSIARSTVSRRPAFSSPPRPMLSSTPSSTLRLLTLTTKLPRGIPSASMVSAAIMHISASAAGEAEPTVSASNCMNWRIRPYWLLVAIDIAGAIAAIGFWQMLEILGDIARQRRGQVVAQADPLLVIVLEREHALVGRSWSGRNFPNRVGVFHRRGFHRLEAVKLIDLADLRPSPASPRSRKARDRRVARQPGSQFLRFFGFLGHRRRWYQPRREAATLHSSWPGLSRPSTSSFSRHQAVDARTWASETTPWFGRPGPAVREKLRYAGRRALTRSCVPSPGRRRRRRAGCRRVSPSAPR